MSSLQLPGLSTGIDTKALIDQLMAVERRRLASYTSSVTQYEEKKTAVTELQSPPYAGIKWYHGCRFRAKQNPRLLTILKSHA